jgi:hypothetical protein
VKVKFTISLSAQTAAALKQMAGGDDAEDVKDAIVDHLKDWFEEVRRDYPEDDEEDDDDE